MPTVNVRVVVKKDEPIEKVLKKFKTLCERAGIKKICKAKRYYEKPSEARRRKARKRLRNIAKASYEQDKDLNKTKGPVRFLPPQSTLNAPTPEVQEQSAKPHEVVISETATTSV